MVYNNFHSFHTRNLGGYDPDHGRTCIIQRGGSYISDLQYELLTDVDTTEGELGLIFGNRCTVKLYSYITFCNAFLILIVAN